MLNPRSKTAQKNGLLNLEIPMKKSYIVDEFMSDLVGPSAVIRKKSNIQGQKKSKITSQSNISINGASFFVQKLNRIILGHMKERLWKIRDYRKTIVNLGMLQKNAYRSIQSAFLKIKAQSQYSKGQKLDKLISRNKKPHLLFQAIFRLIKKEQIFFLQQIQLISIKKVRMQNIAQIINTLFNEGPRVFYQQLLMRKLRQEYYERFNKDVAISELAKTVKKIQARNKSEALRLIIERIKFSSIQKLNNVKKDYAVKLNQTSGQKAKIISQERENLRNLKVFYENFCSDSSKARFQIRRDLNAYRNKLKQQEKKGLKAIAQLESLINTLNAQKDQYSIKHSKRNQRIHSKINQSNVKNLFVQLLRQNPNQAGEIRLKLTGKQLYPQGKDYILKLDEFHLYQNQKLRQQLAQYEELTVFDNLWPQEQTALQQNEALKQMVHLLVERGLQAQAYLPELAESLK